MARLRVPVAVLGLVRLLPGDGRGSMRVTNHAFVTGVANPEPLTVLDVRVDDRSPLVPVIVP